MRDILLVAFFAIALPLTLWRPVWGALGWVWFGIFNPHRYAWGFATTLPFAAAIFTTTAIGALCSKDPKRLKGGAATAVLLLFLCYTVVTTFFALVPDKAWLTLERTLKVQLGTLLVLLILYRKEHVIALMWTVAASIGFYAVKGGIFTILTLGQYRVWGPAYSDIADNNAFALASVISIPIWAFLYVQYRDRRWIKLAILAAIGLSTVSVIGSHSRGALLAILAMAGFLWLKSRLKIFTGAAMLCTAIALVSFMPERWEARMETITNPRADASANSRLEVWTMLLNLANDRPLTGGGFGAYSDEVYEKYYPSYRGRRLAAHSIYFQVLGEHGWVALGLFLTFWALVWRMCGQVARLARNRADYRWAYWLAQMLQVSLIAYLVGGAFLNLAYWDVPYYLFVAIAVTRVILRQAEAGERAAAPAVVPGSGSYVPGMASQRTGGP